MNTLMNEEENEWVEGTEEWSVYGQGVAKNKFQVVEISYII